MLDSILKYSCFSFNGCNTFTVNSEFSRSAYLVSTIMHSPLWELCSIRKHCSSAMEKWTVHMQWAGWTRSVVQEKSLVLDPCPFEASSEVCSWSPKLVFCGRMQLLMKREKCLAETLKKEGEAGKGQPTAGISPVAGQDETYQCRIYQGHYISESDERGPLQCY